MGKSIKIKIVCKDMGIGPELEQDENYEVPFSDCYKSLRDLGADESELEADLIIETYRLRNEVNAYIITEIEELFLETGEFPGDLIFDDNVQIPDVNSRLSAVKEAEKLYNLSGSKNLKRLLKDVYKRNDSKEVRVGAGFALGYSKNSIDLHEFFLSNKSDFYEELVIKDPFYWKRTLIGLGVGIMAYNIIDFLVD